MIQIPSITSSLDSVCVKDFKVPVFTSDIYLYTSPHYFIPYTRNFKHSQREFMPAKPFLTYQDTSNINESDSHLDQVIIMYFWLVPNSLALISKPELSVQVLQELDPIFNAMNTLYQAIYYQNDRPGIMV